MAIININSPHPKIQHYWPDLQRPIFSQFPFHGLMWLLSWFHFAWHSYSLCHHCLHRDFLIILTRVHDTIINIEQYLRQWTNASVILKQNQNQHPPPQKKAWNPTPIIKNKWKSKWLGIPPKKIQNKLSIYGKQCFGSQTYYSRNFLFFVFLGMLVLLNVGWGGHQAQAQPFLA